MDINKDGQLDKNDLRGAFDNVGVLMNEGELDSSASSAASSANPCLMAPIISYSSEVLASLPFSAAKISQIFVTNSFWCRLARFRTCSSAEPMSLANSASSTSTSSKTS